ncbi:hypothetical protein E2C01_081415 [Portunus trituberculatus]|uniref:Uncharacterized protein n=1 Tax=Portunus trituberculatus TaxID=210409 RepID=A0A5B7IM71_PORTR|nr:hypothetical protein [Portunus trituberculatus]
MEEAGATEKAFASVSRQMSASTQHPAPLPPHTGTGTPSITATYCDLHENLRGNIVLHSIKTTHILTYTKKTK